MMLRLQLADGFELAAGKQAGPDFVDAGFAGDGFGGEPRVAGEHERADAEIVQLADGLSGLGAELVGGEEDGLRLRVHQKIDRRSVSEFGARDERGIEFARRQQRRIAEKNLTALCECAYADAGNDLDI